MDLIMPHVGRGLNSELSFFQTESQVCLTILPIVEARKDGFIQSECNLWSSLAISISCTNNWYMVCVCVCVGGGGARAHTHTNLQPGIFSIIIVGNGIFNWSLNPG